MGIFLLIFTYLNACYESQTSTPSDANLFTGLLVYYTDTRASTTTILTSLILYTKRLRTWRLIHFNKCHFTSIGNPIVEIRRSYDRLISTMGFPILVRWHLYIESGPWWCWIAFTRKCNHSVISHRLRLQQPPCVAILLVTLTPVCDINEVAFVALNNDEDALCEASFILWSLDPVCLCTKSLGANKKGSLHH